MYYLHEFFITEWAEQVYIPVEILNKIALWIVAQQNAEGQIIETAEYIYNRHFGVK